MNDGTSAHPSRHRGRRLIIGLVAAVVVVAAAWGVFVWVVQPGDPPSFYSTPDSLPAAAPGTIVRSEPVDPTGHDARVWRTLYTSTDPAGEPIAVSGIVVAPSGEPPADGWPVIAWAHGTSGVASRCAPSLFPGAGLSRIPELDALLAAGNVVVVTDYPGLGTAGPHPYLIGESEGRAVLDSVRAARNLMAETSGSDAATNSKAVVYGHSQGGHATLFAGELAASYAPDIDLVGLAAMAPPTELAVLFDDDIHEVNGIVLAALALSAWSDLYPQADLATLVHEVARPAVHDVGTKCIVTTDQGFTDLADVAVLSKTFLSADPAHAPGWSELLTANSPTSVPTGVPTLIAQGLDDDLVRPDVTAAFVTTNCTAGATIQYDEYPGEDHFGVRTAAAPSVRDWMLARLAGTSMTPGCTRNPDAAATQ